MNELWESSTIKLVDNEDMSMHRIPLTPLEEAGLKAHSLTIGGPSQLSDVFRHGVKWAKDNLHSESDVRLILEAFDNIELRKDLAQEIRKILGVSNAS